MNAGTFGSIMSVMVRTLEIAVAKAAELPEAVQEQLGLEILEWIDAIGELRVAIEVGVRQLDAGEGKELDMEATISGAPAAPAKGKAPGCLSPVRARIHTTLQL